MSGIEFGLGLFGDLRRKKGGPICTKRWWRGQGAAFGGWPEPEGGRCNSRASFTTQR